VGGLDPRGGIRTSRLRRTTGGLLAGIVGLCLWGAASAGASGLGPLSHAATACPGNLLQRTSGGSLTKVDHQFGAGPEEESAYLCSSAGGRPFLVDEVEEYGLFTYSGLIFAGEQAALAFGSGTIEELQVVDLATGKMTYRKALPEVTAHPNSTEVGRIVLERDGSVAWTELVPTGTYEVIKHTAGGTKVLDNTHTTRPYSLKLTGSTLHWLEHDGEERTATLG